MKKFVITLDNQLEVTIAGTEFFVSPTGVLIICNNGSANPLAAFSAGCWKSAVEAKPDAA